MSSGKPNTTGGEPRRVFLKKTATAALAVAGAGPTASLLPHYGGEKDVVVSIVPDPEDSLVKEAPLPWAVGRLQEALEARGLRAQLRPSLQELASAGDCILVAGGVSKSARQILQRAGVSIPEVPEALGLVRGKVTAEPDIQSLGVLLACGSDVRGLVYALLELADRVRFASDPGRELRRIGPVVQKPANQVRSVARLFASEVEDKSWFNDRVFWQRYLTELATQRFNRFSLTLGLGYDFPTDIRDAYFHFAYPFLVAVSGYNVRAVPLPDAERERNLEMLRFISEETIRRGLRFQLGVWTHAYQWVDSPKANYVIEGLTPETHAPYCRDALAALLRACPAIGGVTFRIHGESGIAEGSYEFWRVVFEGVVRAGRRVEIDMHAKGMDDRMIELALATGMPVTISPKFWAEHAGLGYMQGAIRPQEMPPAAGNDTGFFSRSSGSRRFLRYGYGDLLREDRRYGVLHRIWPGTQRLLLWGDPDLAADYGRASSFCGSIGVEWCEPLSFKGRKGSGLPGGREGYADPSLRPGGGDFEKYLYTYRVWGRRIYDPDCDPDEWRRLLRQDFGSGARSVETALHEAGRILPLVTTAHCPSAANNNYWPEMYTNMAIVDAKRPHPYGDTLSPKRFGTVSPLDPEFFFRIDDFAGQLLSGQPSAKYSPAWVAATLEAVATEAERALARAQSAVRDPRSPSFRRVAADVAIQSGLGHFFAWKLRAAVLFALYERAAYLPALKQALEAYRRAREAWARLAEAAGPVYRSDVTFGPARFQRGHWLDRLPAIDEDLADMQKLVNATARTKPAPTKAEQDLIRRAIEATVKASPELQSLVLPGFHVPPKSFRRGQPLTIEGSLGRTRHAPRLESVQLRFRRVNQAELWQVKEMAAAGATYRASISAEYTDSPYPLQYHFELRDRSGAAWFYPGLKPGSQGPPYFVVRQERPSDSSLPSPVPEQRPH